MPLNLLKNSFILFILILGQFLFNQSFGQSIHWQKLPLKINKTPRIFYSDSLTGKLIVSGEFTEVDSFLSNTFLFNGNKVSFFNGSNFKFQPFDIIKRNNGQLFFGGDGLYIYADTGLIRVDSNKNSNQVITLFENNNQLLIGGIFGNSINPKIQYAPVSILDQFNWHPLYGIDTILKDKSYGISSIISYKNELFVAGNISPIGKIKEILKWDNTKWTDVGGGIPGIGDEWVTDMEIYKGELYVAGRFLRATGAIDNNIIRWDGTQWKDVGGGVEGTMIYDMQIFDNELWVVGKFYAAGGIPADNIAKWDGTKWCSLGSKFNNGLVCLGVYKNELYLGGGFTSIDGDTSIKYIAKWIGGNYTDTCAVKSYVGINESERSNFASISVYPNPCHNKLIIRNVNGINNQNTDLKIYNSIGQEMVVNKGDFINNELIIDVKNLKAGIYICEYEFNHQIFRMKFQKD